MAENVRARTYILSRSRCNAVGQQTIRFFLDDRVAFTRASLETGAIHHGNVPTAVFDQPRRLQVSGRLSDAFAAYTEHVGDQFLRHDEVVARQPVETQQQPATQLLIRPD
jgi:hypothetical protein